MYLCDTYECIGRMCSCLYVIHEAHVHVVIAKTFNLEPGHQGFNDFGRFPLNFSHGFLRFRGVFVLPFKSGDQLKWDCEWVFFSNFKNLKLIYRP